MSRSVKSFYTCHPTPAVTCRLIWRVVIVLSLVDSQLILSNASPHSGGKNHPPKWWLNPTLDGSDDNRIPEHPRMSSTFKFKTPDFEFSYDIFRVNAKTRGHILPDPKSVKDMINEAIEAKFNSLSDKEKPFRFGNRGLDIPKTMIPPSCEADLICEDRDNYPKATVEAIMKGFNSLQVLVPPYERPIADRLGADEENLCKSNDDTWFPTSIRENLTAPWHLVVNTDDLQQEVGVSHCKDAGIDCSKNLGSPQSNYRTICKQQYSQQLMIVVKSGMDKPTADFFPIPAGCCCHMEEMAYGIAGNLVERSYRSYNHRGKSPKYN